MVFVTRAFVSQSRLSAKSAHVSACVVTSHGKAATVRLSGQSVRRLFSSNAFYELRANSWTQGTSKRIFCFKCAGLELTSYWLIATAEGEALPKEESEIPSTDDSSIAQQVRYAMRKVAHAVVAITVSDSQTSGLRTSTDASKGASASLQAGMLASSFNTVSLEPDPIVSFNVRLPSRTYDAIVRTGAFEVSPLWSIHAAKAFESGQSNTNKMLLRSERLTNERLFGFRCEWLKDKSMEVADHVIMLGKVVKVVDMPESKSPLSALVYSDGQYRLVTDSVLETLNKMKKELREKSARTKKEEKEKRAMKREERRKEALEEEKEKEERLTRKREEIRKRGREEREKMRDEKREEKEKLDLMIASL